MNPWRSRQPAQKTNSGYARSGTLFPQVYRAAAPPFASKKITRHGVCFPLSPNAACSEPGKDPLDLAQRQALGQDRGSATSSIPELPVTILDLVKQHLWSWLHGFPRLILLRAHWQSTALLCVHGPQALAAFRVRLRRSGRDLARPGCSASVSGPILRNLREGRWALCAARTPALERQNSR
jgi:hypothetical protein